MAYRGQAKRNHLPLKRVEYNACLAKHGKSTPSMLMGEAQPLGTGAREPGCEQTRRMIRADFIPALSWDWPIMPGKVMQGRPEGGGSFGNGILHSRPLPRRRMS
jgi:hypothetical protein